MPLPETAQTPMMPSPLERATGTAASGRRVRWRQSAISRMECSRRPPMAHSRQRHTELRVGDKRDAVDNATLRPFDNTGRGERVVALEGVHGQNPSRLAHSKAVATGTHA